MSLLESSQRSNRRRPSSTGSSASTAGDAPSSFPLTPDSHSHNNPSPLRRTRAAVDTTARGAIPSDEGERQRMSGAAHADRGSAESIELVPGFAVTFAEAAEYLQIYRKDYMPVFPFVIVEETAKPHELHRNAPALFWMIMAAVAQTSEEVDAALKTWLRHYVAETMIIKQEKTLELLQAILVHLVWGSFHFYIDVETPLFMNPAQNIVFDLKLDWPPEQGQLFKYSLLGAAWCHMNKPHLVRRREPHTPAETRAVLGLHYATSVSMSMFRRGPGVTWNSYLTKSCESIAALCQHPLDEALAAWARSAGRRRPLHDRGPLLLLYAKKLRWISQWYEARTVADDLAAAAAAAGSGGGGGGNGGGVGGAAAEAAMITPPEDTPGHEAAVDSASLAGMDMMATDQQPIPSFLPDFQFDEAFWQDMLLGTQQPAFGHYSMGTGTL
ncbi:hypothetical protein MY1884_004338 [Beauveria asiatica]